MSIFKTLARQWFRLRPIQTRQARRVRPLLELLENRVNPSNLTISSAMLFDSLDGSASDDDGVHNGILTVNGNLTIQNGGSINANDNWAGSVPNSSAQPPIVIKVGGDLTIQADTAGLLDTGIFAENRDQGGVGGDITLTVGGNFIMENGATISSSDKTSGGNPGGSGDISIDVTGGTVDMQTGSVIAAGYLASSNGPGGAISIITESSGEAGAIDIDGSVLSQSGLTGTGATQAPGGGPITIIAGGAGTTDNPPVGADLTVSDSGVISSAGKDPGADLVHLQGCEVTVYGLVESTGPGHAIPNTPKNHLDSTYRPDKPANSTGGVEIWAGHSLIIDSTGSHNGEINADTSTAGGTQGIGWIDLFVGGINQPGILQIIGKTGVSDPFTVHANSGLGSDPSAGLITIKVIHGTITASGHAVQSDATGAGSSGGTIVMEASDKVTLDHASLYARGDFDQSGGYGKGGNISVRSYNADISWLTGVGDVRPTGTDNVGTVLPTTSRGTITLTYKTSVNDTGTTYPDNGSPNTVPVKTQNLAGGNPTVPSYVVFPTCDPTPPPAHALDFGDAPDISGGASFPGVPNTYQTLFANNGAYHVIHTDVNGNPDFLLGHYEDDETDGHPSADAKGDDTTAGLTQTVPIPPGDEDGISSQVTGGQLLAGLPSFIFPGETFTLHVFLTDTAGLTAKLDGWVDWNGDGNWTTPGDQIFTSQTLVAGDNSFTIIVPSTAIVSVAGATTFARFRLSTTGGLTPGGAADADPAHPVAFGEVEDYKTQVFPYWTDKGSVISQIEQNTEPHNIPETGNCFAIPDVLVDVDNGPAVFDVTRVGTLAPATNSIQAAIDYVNAFGVSPISGVAGDVNGDGFLLIGVTAKDTVSTFTVTCGGETHTVVGRDLGGDGTENYVITNVHTARLNVFGNSVNIHALDKTKPVETIKGTAGVNGKITALDIHAWDSYVAGVLVGGPSATDKNDDLVVVKNTNAINNKNGSNTGVGIWIMDDNVQVTGSQHIYGNNIGIQIDGDNDILRTNNEIMDNNILGIKITGNNNEANDQDVGKSGHPNGAGILVTGNNNNIHDGTISFNNGTGIKVTGTGNTVQSNDVLSNKTGGNLAAGILMTGNSNLIYQNNVFSNLGTGIYIIGDSNTIQKNFVGDKNKGNSGDGIVISGKTNLLQENTTNYNTGKGIYIKGATSTGNKLKNNKSSLNTGAEYTWEAALVDQGGNKKDNNANAILTGATGSQ